jgi:hypothetical protein
MNQFLVLLVGEVLFVTAFVTLRNIKNEKRWLPDIRRVA